MYLRTLVALFHRFRVCFVLFVRPTDFLHHLSFFRTLSYHEFCNWRLPYDLVNFVSSHRIIDEERRQLEPRIGRGEMEDGLTGAFSILQDE